MRRLLMAVSLSAAMCCGPMAAAMDFHDYDDELMRDLDKTVKYFEPDITAKNADAAKEDAGFSPTGSTIPRIISPRRATRRTPWKSRARAPN